MNKKLNVISSLKTCPSSKNCT